IGTIVFLMGVKNLPKITSQLIKHGMPSDTPVALVRWGTTPRQFSVAGTLENINERVKSIGLKPPAIIVVGNVVTLRKKMSWFENRPLMGKRIVVTRAREQASDLVKQLSDLGAECLECPTIKVVPPDDWKPLDAAIENISSYDWLVFTSVNGVNYFFERLFSKGNDARALGKLNTAVIGPATERRLFNFGLKSDIVPKSYRAESIIEAFGNEDVNGKKILLPRAKEARPILPVELTKMGATVDEITSYYTKEVPDSADLLLKRLKENTIDLITFTSSSTVKNFKAILPDNVFETQMKDITIACIGPITADTAKNLGFEVHIVAKSFTIPGLCEAILDYYNVTTQVDRLKTEDC
ncbi:MAG: uroporphyrinogen-III synthase, partial [Desulfobacterales bacterium]|nr:uroporphyrinogen-III synthase [Desulfobacterales bacterium]